MAATTLEPFPVRPAKTPRVWPVLLFIALGIALYFAPNLVQLAPESMPVMLLFMAFMWGPALCALMLVGWWLIAGPAPFRTRILVVGVGVLLAAGAVFAADSSMRMFFVMHGIPGALGAAALALLLPARLPGLRAVTALVLGVAALGPWDLGRFNGMTGLFGMDFSFRWTKTAEEEALDYAKRIAASAKGPANEVIGEAGSTDWPAFRGSKRDGIALIGVGDWSQTPPREVWRHPVGPAWSSFCVIGDRLFTQEQLGQEELVTCYRVADGQLIWKHVEEDRHFDAQSGPGPRATPTFHEGKVYSLGARGLLTCLDAGNGALVWKVDLKEAVKAQVPMWGMSGSPLVVDDKVIVNPGVKDTPRLVAFDAKTGTQVWAEGTGGDGYSSPQHVELAGVPQVLIYTGDGLFSHDPATGKELWQYSWATDGASPAVTQPLILAGDKVVLGGGRIGLGTRCLQITKGEEGWKADNVVWQTTKFSPGFNDFVHHAGFLYGLEGGRLVCVDVATGKPRWRDGHYGGGQVLLAGDKLVVQAEDGQLVLVNPTPEGLQEIGTRDALKEKTWNHPVVANGRLFVRNAREAVCFDLGEAPVQK